MLVLEVGGTTLRAARFDPERRCLQDRRASDTPSHPNGGSRDDDVHREVLRSLARLAGEVMAGEPPASVAIAYAGPVDRQGQALAAPTVLRRSGGPPYPLRAACSQLWPQATVHALNDLTAAGYRYVRPGLPDFAILTVGSGIGHKVFLDGRPLLGSAGRGGEIGHLRLDFSPDAPPCDCGGLGHLGGLASGRGTVALVRRLAAREPGGFRTSLLARLVQDLGEIDGHTVAAAYLAGDAFTTAAVGDAVRYLGQGLAAIHLDTGVERFLLIGGFARALGERYRRQVVTAAGAAGWQLGQDWDQMVLLGAPDDDSALIGAGIFATGAVG